MKWLKKILPNTLIILLFKAKSRALEYIGAIHDRAVFLIKLKLVPSPIFVYTPAKVGSMSIYRSLLSQYKGVVVKGHYFFQTFEEGLNHGTPRTSVRSEQVEKWSSQIIRLYKYAIKEKKELNVITLIREPISRNISAFFSNFERDVGVPFAQSKFTTTQLKDIFLSCDTGGNYHFWILDWFDKNIKNILGIDVFAYPFPQNGYAIYKKQNIRLLIMKLETPDDLKVEAIKEFLGLKEFCLFKFHTADQQEYADAYKDFKTKIKLPADYVEKMTVSELVNHFYSEDEIQTMINKWGDS
jgi:hypothetical protein